MSDEQIKAIKELDGIIGIVGVKDFCTKNDNVNIKQEYIQNITHIKQILENVNNIAIATDDMSYYIIEPEYYQKANVFKQNRIDKEINKLLKQNKYTKNEIKQIKYKNFEKFLT